MKRFWIALCCLSSTFAHAGNNVVAETTAATLLEQMSDASRSKDYELSYITINKQGIESLRYRHVLIGKETLSQLLQMDGPRREVLQRGNDISYFEPGIEPFTLTGDYIVDALPSVVFADFPSLSNYYDFIPVGQTRVSDRPCEVIRVVSRDGTRFSYVIWIDAESKLPLRIDLLDRDGDTLEQYRVISFDLGNSVTRVMKGLQNAHLPPLLSIAAKSVSTPPDFSWQPRWLPDGFREISRNSRRLPSMDTPIESRLYSDGIFSFAVNVNTVERGKPTIGSDQYVRQGRRTVQNIMSNNYEISVVGELPPATAKRVASSLRFGLPSGS